MINDEFHSTKISAFLQSNSSIRPSRIYGGGYTTVPIRAEYRPDRAFGANKNMKWAMILAGIDSPWRLVRGALIPLPDAITLAQEVNGLSEDFHI